MNEILDMFRLDGRVAIVTGASRGIGNAIACGLASAGARVYGLGRSPAAKNGAYGFTYRTCDVTDSMALGKLANDVFSEAGHIDVLVNAAGITLPAQSINSPVDTFNKTIACNLTAIFESCRLIVPYMLHGNYGSIINITSIGATLGFPGNPGYVASKGGLAALTRALALDHGEQGIRVNNLVPGYIRTTMTEGSYTDTERQHARAARTLLGRWGEANELVGAAIFLASQASSYVTGTDLIVDGGWTAKGL